MLWDFWITQLCSLDSQHTHDPGAHKPGTHLTAVRAAGRAPCGGTAPVPGAFAPDQEFRTASRTGHPAASAGWPVPRRRCL
jgi:hypothetical protein